MSFKIKRYKKFIEDAEQELFSLKFQLLNPSLSMEKREELQNQLRTVMRHKEIYKNELKFLEGKKK